MPFGSRSFDDDPLGCDPSCSPLAQDVPHGRNEQRQAHDVCQETWGQQQRTGYEDHGSVDQRSSGNTALFELLSSLDPGGTSLPRHEPGTDERRHHDDEQRPPDPDLGTDQIEQDDLNDRNDDEAEEEPGSEPHTGKVDGTRPTHNALVGTLS